MNRWVSRGGWRWPFTVDNSLSVWRIISHSIEILLYTDFLFDWLICRFIFIFLRWFVSFYQTSPSTSLQGLMTRLDARWLMKRYIGAGGQPETQLNQVVVSQCLQRLTKGPAVSISKHKHTKKASLTWRLLQFSLLVHQRVELQHKEWFYFCNERLNSDRQQLWDASACLPTARPHLIPKRSQMHRKLLP